MANDKGGCGKTTTSVNLTAALADQVSEDRNLPEQLQASHEQTDDIISVGGIIDGKI